MRNLLIFGVIIACLIILTGMAFFKDKYMSEEGVKIVIYKQGKEIPIDPGTLRFKELQEKCEEFFESAKRMAKGFISKKLTGNIKAKQIAIEVIYNKPKEIEISYFKKKVKANHLLIPLKGKYVDTGKNANVMMLFYSEKLHTSPCSADRDVTEIINLLKSMGIDIE